MDATGDADLCAFAGTPTARAAGNVTSGWFFYEAGGEVQLSKTSARHHPEGRAVGEGPFFRGDRAEDVSAFIVASHRLIRSRLAQLREQHAPKRVEPVTLPMMASFRMTRRLKAPFALAARDEGRSFRDAVGLFGDWRRAGPVWDLPLRTLIAPGPHNLAVAGRCISANRTVWDVTRAIPVCALSGEAAGVAAALIARDAAPDFRRLDPKDVRARLAEQGAILARPGKAPSA